METFSGFLNEIKARVTETDFSDFLRAVPMFNLRNPLAPSKLLEQRIAAARGQDAMPPGIKPCIQNHSEMFSFVLAWWFSLSIHALQIAEDTLTYGFRNICVKKSYGEMVLKLTTFALMRVKDFADISIPPRILQTYHHFSGLRSDEPSKESICAKHAATARNRSCAGTRCSATWH